MLENFNKEKEITGIWVLVECKSDGIINNSFTDDIKTTLEKYGMKVSKNENETFANSEFILDENGNVKRMPIVSSQCIGHNLRAIDPRVEAPTVWVEKEKGIENVTDINFIGRGYFVPNEKTDKNKNNLMTFNKTGAFKIYPARTKDANLMHKSHTAVNKASQKVKVNGEEIECPCSMIYVKDDLCEEHFYFKCYIDIELAQFISSDPRNNISYDPSYNSNNEIYHRIIERYPSVKKHFDNLSESPEWFYKNLDFKDTPEDLKYITKYKEPNLGYKFSNEMVNFEVRYWLYQIFKFNITRKPGYLYVTNMKINLITDGIINNVDEQWIDVSKEDIVNMPNLKFHEYYTKDNE